MKVSTFVIVSIVAFMTVYLVSINNRPDPMTRDYSQAQWMEMITHSEHQATTIWEGWGDSQITRSQAGSSGGVLSFRETSAHILEHQRKDLLKKDPFFFWSALESDDKRVLQTGLYIYHFRIPNADTEVITKLAGVYRKLLDHRDTGLRVYAIYRLNVIDQLNVNDIRKGLSDPVGDVRFSTAFSMSKIFSDHLVYTKDGKINKGSVERANELVEIKRKLAPIFLERMNDPRLSTRFTIANKFIGLFRRYELSESGGTYDKLPVSMPARIDWRRESWYKCEESRKLLQKWWAEHGEEALKFAHPPQ